MPKLQVALLEQGEGQEGSQADRSQKGKEMTTHISFGLHNRFSKMRYWLRSIRGHLLLGSYSKVVQIVSVSERHFVGV